MTAEAVKQFQDLEAQADAIMAVFSDAGYEYVAPAIIQPADVFLDVVGESIRGRTYVFTDPDGEELCLRPDMTVPTARLYLERFPEADSRARYAYNGAAFRFRSAGDAAIDPREFRHAGVESIGGMERDIEDAKILAILIEAVESAGLKDYRLKFGDLGLFQALLNALKVPKRWQTRLRHQFWKPDTFRTLVQKLSSEDERALSNVPKELQERLDPSKPSNAKKELGAYLEANNIPLIGARTLAEITAHLLEEVEDVRTEPLSTEAANLIESYVGITAPPRAAGARIEDLVSESGIDLGAEIDAFRRRIDRMSEAGIDFANAEFSAEFGRNLEYYTGLVFEINVDSLNGRLPIAGGGRYDDLLKSIGASHTVPGVGGAIHTERLMAAVRGEL